MQKCLTKSLHKHTPKHATLDGFVIMSSLERVCLTMRAISGGRSGCECSSRKHARTAPCWTIVCTHTTHRRNLRQSDDGRGPRHALSARKLALAQEKGNASIASRTPRWSRSRAKRDKASATLVRVLSLRAEDIRRRADPTPSLSIFAQRAETCSVKATIPNDAVSTAQSTYTASLSNRKTKAAQPHKTKTTDLCI